MLWVYVLIQCICNSVRIRADSGWVDQSKAAQTCFVQVQTHWVFVRSWYKNYLGRIGLNWWKHCNWLAVVILLVCKWIAAIWVFRHLVPMILLSIFRIGVATSIVACRYSTWILEVWHLQKAVWCKDMCRFLTLTSWSSTLILIIVQLTGFHHSSTCFANHMMAISTWLRLYWLRLIFVPIHLYGSHSCISLQYWRLVTFWHISFAFHLFNKSLQVIQIGIWVSPYISKPLDQLSYFSVSELNLESRFMYWNWSPNVYLRQYLLAAIHQCGTGS